jgi:hypothetical protein
MNLKSAVFYHVELEKVRIYFVTLMGGDEQVAAGWMWRPGSGNC